MAASHDQTASLALADALAKRERKEAVEREYADAYLRFLRDARAAGWSWSRIGDALGISDRAAEKYWTRNRLRAGRLGDVGTATAAA